MNNVLIIQGPYGSGKTKLVEWLTREAIGITRLRNMNDLEVQELSRDLWACDAIVFDNCKVSEGDLQILRYYSRSVPVYVTTTSTNIHWDTCGLAVVYTRRVAPFTARA